MQKKSSIACHPVFSYYTITSCIKIILGILHNFKFSIYVYNNSTLSLQYLCIWTRKQHKTPTRFDLCKVLIGLMHNVFHDKTYQIWPICNCNLTLFRNVYLFGRKINIMRRFNRFPFKAFAAVQTSTKMFIHEEI